MQQPAATPRHPHFNRRDILQAGTLGLMGLSLADVRALQASTPESRVRRTPRSVIYLFLSGGLSQHDSFDPKLDAPDNIRGEFRPMQTRTAGVHVCEHLPRLAERSDRWAVVRSLSHPTNDHSLGHHIMLTGRSDAPVGFSPVRPNPTDHPSIATVAGRLLHEGDALWHDAPRREALPAAAVVPYHLVHDTGRVIPGQFAGHMGPRHDPWLLHTAHYCQGYGACPNCFDHQSRPNRQHAVTPIFQTPNLSLPEGLTQQRLSDRRNLLRLVERQQRQLDGAAALTNMDQHRAMALSLLTSTGVRDAFDLDREPLAVHEAYGRNLFGWSCLLARRLVEAGVSLIQVNLGRNETWDTHGNAFPHLKNDLLPPMDQCVSALIDDLDARGLLESTMIVMAGEFGRTPRISWLQQHYASAGRDHWGAVQTAFFAGGGVKGGTVIGSSDRNGGFPQTARQTPENLAATIYHALGIDRHAVWNDATNRPYHVYHAEPIEGLML